MAAWNRKVKVVVSAFAITVTCAVLAIVVIFVVTQPHGARIVDCVSGYHNVSGPSSDCVSDSLPASP